MRRRVLAIIALALALLVMAPVAATATEDPPPQPVALTVRWALTSPPGGWTVPPTNVTATWPQALADGTECDGWWQEDDYLAPQAVLDAILADGRLDRGEDSRVVVSWRFVQQPACPVVVDPPPLDPEPDPEPEPAQPASPALAAPTFAG